MLKHLPKDSLKKNWKTLPYSKQPVYYNSASLDTRIHNGAIIGFDVTGLNVTQVAALKKTTQRV